MKYGIIGAIEKEIIFIRKKLKNCKIKKINYYTFYFGEINKKQIILLKSGIGKVSSSIGTTILLLLFKPNIVINIGCAGSLQQCLSPGDIILPDKVCYYDVDLTAFHYPMGQIPKYPHSFLVRSDLTNIIKKYLVTCNLKFKTGLLISGDSFVHGGYNFKKIQKYFPEALSVDMESTAIVHTCYLFNTPIIIIRVISDYADIHAESMFHKSIKSNFCITITDILLNIID